MLAFDFFRRGFKERLEELADDSRNLKKIDDCLWAVRVPLAASISRIRIRKNAKDNEQLLPRHLRSKDFGYSGSHIVGWINIFKTS